MGAHPVAGFRPVIRGVDIRGLMERERDLRPNRGHSEHVVWAGARLTSRSGSRQRANRGRDVNGHWIKRVRTDCSAAGDRLSSSNRGNGTRGGLAPPTAGLEKPRATHVGN